MVNFLLLWRKLNKKFIKQNNVEKAHLNSVLSFFWNFKIIKINSFNTAITEFPNGERGYEFTVSDVEHVRLFLKYEDDKDIFF